MGGAIRNFMVNSGEYERFKQQLQSHLGNDILLTRNFSHIMVVDSEMQMYFSNQLPFDELINVKDMIYLTDIGLLDETIQLVSSSRESQHQMVRNSTGELMDIQVHQFIEQYFILIITVIGNYFEIEEETKLNNDKYRTLVNHSAIPFFELDMRKVLELLSEYDDDLETIDDELWYEIYDTTKISYYNQSYKDLYSIDLQLPRLSGKELMKRFPSQKVLFKDFIQQWFAGEKLITIESEIMTEQGIPKYILGSYSTLYGHGREFLLASIQDITKLREYKQRLARKRALLYQSMKMWGVGKMISSITHDFNTYLALLQSQLDLLIIQEDQKEMIDTIRTTLRQASQLSRNILNYTRMQDEHQTIIIDHQIPELLERLSIILKQQITIKTDLHAGNAEIDLSQQEMEQLLLNLLMNANDAIPKGGVVEISTKLEAIGDEQYVQLRFKDNGEGMDEDTIQHLFDPFFTTKSERMGTGLGMSIIKDITKKHRGQIKVNSIPGQGTTFVIEFPFD